MVLSSLLSAAASPVTFEVRCEDSRAYTIPNGAFDAKGSYACRDARGIRTESTLTPVDWTPADMLSIVMDQEGGLWFGGMVGGEPALVGPSGQPISAPVVEGGIAGSLTPGRACWTSNTGSLTSDLRTGAVSTFHDGQPKTTSLKDMPGRLLWCQDGLGFRALDSLTYRSPSGDDRSIPIATLADPVFPHPGPLTALWVEKGSLKVWRPTRPDALYTYTIGPVDHEVSDYALHVGDESVLVVRETRPGPLTLVALGPDFRPVAATRLEPGPTVRVDDVHVSEEVCLALSIADHGASTTSGGVACVEKTGWCEIRAHAEGLEACLKEQARSIRVEVAEPI